MGLFSICAFIKTNRSSLLQAASMVRKMMKEGMRQSDEAAEGMMRREAAARGC